MTAAILGASAVHKARSPDRTAAALAGMLGVTPRLVHPIVGPVALMEGAAALALLAPPTRVLGAAVAALLWLAYLLVVARALAAGRGGRDCGCSLGGRRAGLGPFQLIRLVVLLATTALAGLDANAGWPSLTAALAATMLFLLYLAAEELAATQASGRYS
ncbi:MAG TPA: MauE/DoxX family redox-associated membrane protein [Phenylobacterium sp.]